MVVQKSKPQSRQVYYVIKAKNKEGGFREMGELYNRFSHSDWLPTNIWREEDVCV